MKYQEEHKNSDCCSVQKILSVIGSKWTLAILGELSSGTKRFSQLQKSLKGISPKTLSARLQELEKEDIVAKMSYPEVPPRVEYSLTPKGESLKKILQDLITWGTKNLRE